MWHVRHLRECYVLTCASLVSAFCFVFCFFSGKMVFLQKRHPTPFSPPVEVFKVTNCISLPKINNLKTWSVISKKKYEAWCVYSINICLIDGVLVASPSKVTFSNSAVTVNECATVQVQVPLFETGACHSCQYPSIKLRQCKRF